MLAFVYCSFEEQILEMGGLDLLVRLLGREHSMYIRRGVVRALCQILQERPAERERFAAAGVFPALLDLWDDPEAYTLGIISALSLLAQDSWQNKDIIREIGCVLLEQWPTLAEAEPGVCNIMCYIL